MNLEVNLKATVGSRRGHGRLKEEQGTQPPPAEDLEVKQVKSAALRGPSLQLFGFSSPLMSPWGDLI